MFYRQPNGTFKEVPSLGTVTLLNTYYMVYSGLKCDVTVRGSVKPDIRVYVDRKDVTDRFEMSTNRSWGRRGWLLERGYTVTLTYQTYHPNVKDDGKWLECRAKVPEYPERKIAVKMNVTCASALTNVDLF